MKEEASQLKVSELVKVAENGGIDEWSRRTWRCGCVPVKRR